jgi:hypothetical protein
VADHSGVSWSESRSLKGVRPEARAVLSSGVVGRWPHATELDHNNNRNTNDDDRSTSYKHNGSHDLKQYAGELCSIGWAAAGNQSAE